MSTKNPHIGEDGILLSICVDVFLHSEDFDEARVLADNLADDVMDIFPHQKGYEPLTRVHLREGERAKNEGGRFNVLPAQQYKRIFTSNDVL